MRDIEVALLNRDAFDYGERFMVAGARLTQRAHNIKNLDDFLELYNKSYTDELAEKMGALPHDNIQRFGFPVVVVVGASRRFLAQITRHQNDVHFISGSLQYSDYTDKAQFVIPYTVFKMDRLHQGRAVLEDGYYTRNYINSQLQCMAEYKSAIAAGIDNDAAAYMSPQGLRNVLIIGATVQQWKHMIAQRVCNRNTLETQYVMLKIWEEFNKHTNMMLHCGADCMTSRCREGHMACGDGLVICKGPTEILHRQFPLYYEGE